MAELERIKKNVKITKKGRRNKVFGEGIRETATLFAFVEKKNVNLGKQKEFSIKIESRKNDFEQSYAITRLTISLKPVVSGRLCGKKIFALKIQIRNGWKTLRKQ